MILASDFFYSLSKDNWPFGNFELSPMESYLNRVKNSYPTLIFICMFRPFIETPQQNLVTQNHVAVMYISHPGKTLINN